MSSGNVTFKTSLPQILNWGTAPATFRGERTYAVDKGFIQKAMASKYSPEHPRINDSDGITGESKHGQVLPYLLA